MTDLSDKWKKGELPDGEYYIHIHVNCKNGYDGIQTAYFYGNTFHTKEFKWVNAAVKEVLAKVPTYEEYQALLSDQLAKNEGVEINAELKAENNKLRRDYISTTKNRIEDFNNAKTLAQTLLKVSPEHREWLETNFKEYL